MTYRNRPASTITGQLTRAEVAKYMAFNHNGTPLLLKPASKARAQKEAEQYSYCTGNAAYIGRVNDAGVIIPD